MKSIIILLNSKYTAIFWTVLIFILCTIPSVSLPKNNDKTCHFLVFAGFTFFWFFHSSKYGQLILIAAFYGIVIEFWQGILPEGFHRSFDWYGCSGGRSRGNYWIAHLFDLQEIG